MGRVNEAVSTFNMTIRTLLATAVVGGLGVGGWLGYSKFHQAETTEKQLVEAQAKLKQLQADLDAKQHQIEALTASLRLLKFNHRVARVRVQAVVEDPETGQKISRVEFTELNDEGQPIGPTREFTLKGDVIYVDYWVVKFEDKYIEQGLDLDRSTSLCLFRRIFGERQKPIEGYAIDPEKSQPLSYSRGGQLSPLEQRIWSDFWSVANDLDKQKELGIRAAHGEAVSMKVMQGKSYLLQLRASDGLTIIPEDNVAGSRSPAA